MTMATAKAMALKAANPAAAMVGQTRSRRVGGRNSARTRPIATLSKLESVRSIPRA